MTRARWHHDLAEYRVPSYSAFYILHSTFDIRHATPRLCCLHRQPLRQAINNGLNATHLLLAGGGLLALEKVSLSHCFQHVLTAAALEKARALSLLPAHTTDINCRRRWQGFAVRPEAALAVINTSSGRSLQVRRAGAGLVERERLLERGCSLLQAPRQTAVVCAGCRPLDRPLPPVQHTDRPPSVRRPSARPPVRPSRAHQTEQRLPQTVLSRSFDYGFQVPVPVLG